MLTHLLILLFESNLITGQLNAVIFKCLLFCVIFPDDLVRCANLLREVVISFLNFRKCFSSNCPRRILNRIGILPDSEQLSGNIGFIRPLRQRFLPHESYLLLIIIILLISPNLHTLSFYKAKYNSWQTLDRLILPIYFRLICLYHIHKLLVFQLLIRLVSDRIGFHFLQFVLNVFVVGG